jgi:glycosyltransferase involved in cell wall biosynthesis
MNQQVVIHWGISSFFGWGVYGLNLALNWAREGGIDARSTFAFTHDQVVVDPLRRMSLRPFEFQTRQFVQQLKEREGQAVQVDALVLSALGNEFQAAKASANTDISGAPTLGVVFYEIPQLSAETLERARRYPLIICGSTWNEQILRAHGVNTVTTVIQGIDPTLFHPAPRQGILSDRFMVFSGGKLELRKGQDLVMAGFARFAKRHPEALLVTAWHSPWPKLAKSLDVSKRAEPMPFNEAGKPDLAAWARANGLADNQFLDLGSVPNALMAPILREMDAALFPNRSEGGTNLVAMEAMACGVPTILSANTGHMDLIDGQNCYALEHQRAVAGEGAGVGHVAGWGESSVEEIDDKLEQIWRDRNGARRRGERGAAKLAGYTWSRTADQMRSIVKTYAK